MSRGGSTSGRTGYQSSRGGGNGRGNPASGRDGRRNNNGPVIVPDEVQLGEFIYVKFLSTIPLNPFPN